MKPLCKNLAGKALVLMALYSFPALACMGCGMAESFTPRMLFIGLGFFLLPILLVSSIIYFIWKDHKARSRTALERTHERPNGR